MLKYNEIIEKLTVKQKIALVTDLKGFSEPAMNELGVPYVSVQSVKDLLDANATGLTPAVLARSWDTSLIEAFTQNAVRNDPHAPNLIITPSPKMQYGKDSTAVSEDTVLSSAMAQAYLCGARKAGAVGCLDEFYLTGDEVAQIDNQMDPRVFDETFAQPFRNTLKQANGEAVLAKMSGPSRGYGALNQSMIRDAEQKILQHPVSILCNATPDETVPALHMGCILLKGSSAVVEAAYEQYLHLRELIASGHASAESLEEAFETGSAISDEMLDEALDRVLSFAMFCADAKAQGASSDMGKEMLLKKAYLDTAVLLKNENHLLPLKERKKIAVIGSLALEPCEGTETTFGAFFTQALSNSCEEIEKGYDFASNRIDDYLPRALAAAKKADVIFVFLGHKPQSKPSSWLPANQIALLDALSEFRHKIVGVLSSDRPINMEFDRYVSGLLLTTVAGRESASALAELVSGAVSPRGRLAKTYYDDPDEEFARQRFYKTVGRNKVGPFMGYRRYDSSEISVRYPFGFGLGYSGFAYSNLCVYPKEIVFSVENTGKYVAVETGQVYIGVPKSKMVRPRKEMKAFFRIELKPKEKKMVRITDLNFEIFSGEGLDRVIEAGDYKIYVGPSVNDIRLTGSIHLTGVTFPDPLEKCSDYLQSESNILSDEYTLEAGFTQMKTYNKWKLAGVLALVFAAVLVILGLWSGGSAAYLLALASLITGIILLAVSSRKKHRYFAELKKAQEESAKKLFANVDTVDAGDVENLFAEEFDNYAQEQEDETVLNTADDIFRRVDRDLTLSFVREQLTGFAADRGVSLGGESAGMILSAIASSRLILTNSAQSSEDNKLWNAVSEFFGAPLFAETVTAHHLEGGKLFAVKDEQGVRGTELSNAALYAREHRETVCFAVLKNVNAEDLGKLMTPFTRYFHNPSREFTVYVQENDTTYLIPDNLWFVVELAEGEKIESVPSCVAETATLLRADFVDCEAKQEPDVYRSVGFYDLEYVADMSRNGLNIDEDLWKKVDGIEAYVNARTPYQIGNKLWLQLEKYIAVYTACGFEKNDALDRALAFNLLPVLTSVLKGKLSSEDRTLLEVVEAAFGEEAVAVCRKVLIAGSRDA